MSFKKYILWIKCKDIGGKPGRSMCIKSEKNYIFIFNLKRTWKLIFVHKTSTFYCLINTHDGA